MVRRLAESALLATLDMACAVTSNFSGISAVAE